MTVPDIVALGEEQAEFDHARLEDLGQLVSGELRIGFEQHFAGRRVHDISGNPRAFEVRNVDFDFADLCLLNFLQSRGVELASRVRNLFAGLVLDAVRQLHAQQVGGFFAVRIERPEKLLVANYQPIHGVERSQNVFAGTQAKGAQENRSQELSLAVDADVEHVLLVVFEFDPRSAVRNDLAEEVGAIVRSLEEHARRTVQLADDDTFRAINNEGAVLRHQRNIAEENFLFLDVANGAIASLRVFIEDGETHGDLERRRVSHAALFALAHVVLQLQSNRVAALVAEVGRVGVVRAALAAEHVAGMERIGNDGVAAVLASGAQVMQALQVAALALPVADGVIDELELRDVAEIRNRKHRLENRLQAAVIALAGQTIHLQKAIVGTLLHFDQVRNLDGCWNLGKIKSCAESIAL